MKSQMVISSRISIFSIHGTLSLPSSWTEVHLRSAPPILFKKKRKSLAKLIYAGSSGWKRWSSCRTGKQWLSIFLKRHARGGGGMPGSLWALERCFLWMQHLMLAALALACKGTLLKVGYEKEGKCGGKFNTEAALTYGFSKKLKVFSGVCKNGVYKSMSNMDVSGKSFFQNTGNCFEANLGITKIVGFNFKIGWCLAMISNDTQSQSEYSISQYY